MSNISSTSPASDTVKQKGTPTLLSRSLNIQQFSIFKDQEGAILMGNP